MSSIGRHNRSPWRSCRSLSGYQGISQNLGQEYAAVALAFDYGWGDMVQIALDGVEACWLDESDKAALQARVVQAADDLRPDEDGGSARTR